MLTHAKTIMFIDDDPDESELILTVMDYVSDEINIKTVAKDNDGLAMLKREELKPDLIFLDINMPHMNGRQFLTEIKKLDSLKNIPISILTTSSDQLTISQTKMLGAQLFITEPGKFPGWITVLREALIKFEILPDK